MEKSKKMIHRPRKKNRQTREKHTAKNRKNENLQIFLQNFIIIERHHLRHLQIKQPRQIPKVRPEATIQIRESIQLILIASTRGVSSSIKGIETIDSNSKRIKSSLSIKSPYKGTTSSCFEPVQRKYSLKDSRET